MMTFLRKRELGAEVVANAKEGSVRKLKKKSSEAEGKAAPSSETWFVYLLRCADSTLYTGITKDVSRRCEQHNAGTASRYTRSRLPVSVAYQETQATRSLALKREAAIKAMSRPGKQALIRTPG
jgi:UV DNA damage endonuclease